MFGSAESEHPTLTIREIIFEDFKPRPMIRIPQLHGQTDDLPSR